MQLQTTSPESKFPNEYTGVIFIQIDEHLKKLSKKYKGFPIFWNTVYINLNTSVSPDCSLPTAPAALSSTNIVHLQIF